MTRRRWLALALVADVVVLAVTFGLGWTLGAKRGYGRGFERGAVWMLQQDLAALKHCKQREQR